jgi:hypothetical protein
VPERAACASTLATMGWMLVRTYFTSRASCCGFGSGPVFGDTGTLIFPFTALLAMQVSVSPRRSALLAGRSSASLATVFLSARGRSVIANFLLRDARRFA